MSKYTLLITIFLFMGCVVSSASDIQPPICEITAKVLSVKEEYSEDKYTYLYVEIEILDSGSLIQEGEPPAQCEEVYDVGNINIAKIVKEKYLVDKDIVIKEGDIIKGNILATGSGVPPQFMTGPYPYHLIFQEVEIIKE